MKQAKSNLNRRNLEYRGISNRPGNLDYEKLNISDNMEIESQRYSQWAGIGLWESDGCRK